MTSIEESVAKSIQHLDEKCLRTVSFEEATEYAGMYPDAYFRMEVDRSLLIGSNHTLRSLFCKLVSFIQTHEHEDELCNRLREELHEMSATCTTGYVSRLMNVLSGFEGEGIQISFEDQIKANLQARLNKCIKDEPNSDAILEQMTNTDIAERTAFITFFRKHISTIKEEMYQEFSEYIEDTDWDLYFMKAILQYEA